MTDPRIEQRLNRNDGFTLAEMLVVLTILAITTTIAVQSMVPVAGKASFQATQNTLNSIGAAIVSTSQFGSQDMSPVVTGYVADTGSLPRITYDASTGIAVNDLLFQPTDLGVPVFGDAANGGVILNVPFPQLGNPSNTVNFPWGWRGPYLQPAVGATRSLTVGEILS